MHTLISFLRRNWKITLPVGIAGVALVAWLAFGYFAIQTLFIDDKVNEAGPVFDSGAVASNDDAPDTATTTATAPTTVPSTDGGETPASIPETTTTIAVPEVITVAQGSFIDRDHPTSGVALVLTDGSEQRFLRFEDFETDNGPDLNVYLSKAAPDAPHGDFDAADGYLDLGDLKGNIGPQNYEIPVDVDLAEYSTVVIWCVRFGVAFGASSLVAS